MHFENQEPASKSKVYIAILFAALLSVSYQSINHIFHSRSFTAFFLSEPLFIKTVKTNTKKRQTKTTQNQVPRHLHLLPTCIMFIQLRNLSRHSKAPLHCTISWGFPSQSTAPPAKLSLLWSHPLSQLLHLL